ncbi:cytochrome P450 [Bisporella sp. PMI_857]|nr:cytochrome P450 [Bisporella sp. PMI_857]
MYLTIQLIEAGSDIAREVHNIMVMSSFEYPKPFKKAREEIDRVRGTGLEVRFPTLADMNELPYICAMVKEVLRWRPIFILTPDHISTQEIDFEGYRFHAGVGFVINKAVVGNECEFSEDFVPERWLDDHEVNITHGL